MLAQGREQGAHWRVECTARWRAWPFRRQREAYPAESIAASLTGKKNEPSLNAEGLRRTSSLLLRWGRRLGIHRGTRSENALSPRGLLRSADEPPWTSSSLLRPTDEEEGEVAQRGRSSRARSGDGARDRGGSHRPGACVAPAAKMKLVIERGRHRGAHAAPWRGRSPRSGALVTAAELPGSSGTSLPGTLAAPSADWEEARGSSGSGARGTPLPR